MTLTWMIWLVKSACLQCDRGWYSSIPHPQENDAVSGMVVVTKHGCLICLLLTDLHANCAQVLDPTIKLSYFHKHWSSNLLAEVQDTVHARVSSFLSVYQVLLIYIISVYQPLQKSLPGLWPSIKLTHNHIRGSLICKPLYQNYDNTSSEDKGNNDNTSSSLPNVCLDEWKSYLISNEDIPEGMGTVHWWGVSVTSIPSVYVANTDNTAVEWPSVSHLAISGSESPCHHGVFSVKWMGIFIGWDYN